MERKNSHAEKGPVGPGSISLRLHFLIILGVKRHLLTLLLEEETGRTRSEHLEGDGGLVKWCSRHSCLPTPDGLCLVPGTHEVEGKNWLLWTVLSRLHTYVMYSISK